MRPIALLLALVACSSLRPDQTPPPQVIGFPSTTPDTTFVATKDITPPVLLVCPPIPQSPTHGTVLVAFVVDTFGRPEPPTLKIVRSADDSLSALALRISANCFLRPGRYQSHAVRAAVQLPFTF